MIFLRSFAIYLLTFLAVVLYWTVLLIPSLVVFCCPQKLRRKLFRRLILWSGLFVIYAAWRPFFRIHYEDRSGGHSGPGVIIVNHRSATDAFLVASMREPCGQIVNGWPMRLPILGFFAKFAGYVDITNIGYDALGHMVRELISAGDPIIAFPEGTRSESKKMNPFHSGAFQLAIDLGLSVSMLCIAGNEYMPDRKFRFRVFRDLLIRRLPDIQTDEVRGYGSAYALKKEVFRRMERELAEMDEVL